MHVCKKLDFIEQDKSVGWVVEKGERGLAGVKDK